MIPAALVIAVIVGLFVKWDAGLLAGTLLIWLAPEIFTIFFKGLRDPLMEEEKKLREDKEFKRHNSWYYYLFHEGESNGNDDTGFIPMS